MGLILSLETATSVCSIAVHENGSKVGIIELIQENIHGQKLVPLIDTLLRHVGISIDDIEAVAVSSGPGSFTGLRIGVATAKGLAFAKDIPLIGVDSLDALGRRAKPFIEETDFVVPMIDARRMEVYGKVLNGKLKELVPLAPIIIEETSFDPHLLAGKVFFIGDANKKVKEIIKHQNAVFIPYLNSASTIGELADIKYKKGQFEDLAYFQPNYLKEVRVLKSKKTLLS